MTLISKGKISILSHIIHKNCVLIQLMFPIEKDSINEIFSSNTDNNSQTRQSYSTYILLPSTLLFSNEE